MEALDRVLGLAEFILVGVSLIWLCIAAGRARRRSLLCATALAAVLAVTVAQPLGIVAHQVGQAPEGAKPVKHPAHVHVLRAGPIPVVPFELYSLPDVWYIDTQGVALKARTWMWLPLLTNSSTITRMCLGGFDEPPCWDDASGDHLALWRKGSHYWVGFSPSDPGEETGVWSLGFGLASWAGLAYWALAWTLSLLGWRRVRRRA